MRRVVAGALSSPAIALTIALTTACTGPAESQAGSDPSAPTTAAGTGDTLPLAPDVDPCRLPANLVSILSGLATDGGTFVSTGDAEGRCTYAETDGDQLVVTVDTSGGSSHYDDIDQTTPGEDVASVGDEAFWNDPTLHVLSDGRYWSFTVETNGSDELRRRTVTIAVAQALDL